MSCQRHQQNLSDYIDGLLSAPEQAEIRAHLEACPNCRTICDDLIAIRDACRDLPEYEPSPRVWERISAAIAADPFQGMNSPAGYARMLPWRRFRPSFAVAAAVLVAVLAGVTFLSRSFRGGSPTLSQNPIANWEAQQMQIGIEPTGLILVHKPTVEIEMVEQRIRELEQEIARKRSGWAPDVQRLFERNLAIIDQCIARCRRAAEQTPSDPIVKELYLAAMQAKLEMLKQFVAL
ncbi:MAG TPA: anti-sigma factor [Blastocatellia bacterium]|nr:anti-sigma factor [Blastocatellia bacterium]